MDTKKSRQSWGGFGKRFRCLVAGLATISFIFTNTVIAAPSAADVSNLGTVSGTGALVLPEFGAIDESHIGALDKTVIYIQDAHDSLEAQENIAGLITHLTTKQGVKTVFEEGCEGPVPTDELFSGVSEAGVKEKVSYFFLDQLRIGAAEYAHINRDRAKGDFRLIGADSIRLHLQNIVWSLEAAKTKKETEKDLAELTRHINRLAERNFPKPLREWLKLKDRFASDRLPLFDYIQRTRKILSEKITPEAFKQKFPDLSLLMEARDSQDEAVLNEIGNINAKTLFQEIDDMENQISRSFLGKKRDQQTFQYLKILSLIGRLNNLEVTPAEYEIAKAAVRDLDTKQLAKFIVKQTKRSLVLSKQWETNLKSAESFYETAHARDYSIEAALSRFLKDPNEKTAVLVYGGFHKSGIKDIFAKLGLSYHIVSPKITKADPVHKAYYQQLLSNGFYSYEMPKNAGRFTRTIGYPEIVRSETKVLPPLRAYIEDIAALVQKLPAKLPNFEIASRITSQIRRAGIGLKSITTAIALFAAVMSSPVGVQGQELPTQAQVSREPVTMEQQISVVKAVEQKVAPKPMVPVLAEAPTPSITPIAQAAQNYLLPWVLNARGNPNFAANLKLEDQQVSFVVGNVSNSYATPVSLFSLPVDEIGRFRLPWNVSANGSNVYVSVNGPAGEASSFGSYSAIFQMVDGSPQVRIVLPAQMESVDTMGDSGNIMKMELEDWGTDGISGTTTWNVWHDQVSGEITFGLASPSNPNYEFVINATTGAWTGDVWNNKTGKMIHVAEADKGFIPRDVSSGGSVVYIDGNTTYIKLSKGANPSYPDGATIPFPGVVVTDPIQWAGTWLGVNGVWLNLRTLKISDYPYVEIPETGAMGAAVAASVETKEVTFLPLDPATGKPLENIAPTSIKAQATGAKGLATGARAVTVLPGGKWALGAWNNNAPLPTGEASPIGFTMTYNNSPSGSFSGMTLTSTNPNGEDFSHLGYCRFLARTSVPSTGANGKYSLKFEFEDVRGVKAAFALLNLSTDYVDVPFLISYIQSYFKNIDITKIKKISFVKENTRNPVTAATDEIVIGNIDAPTRLVKNASVSSFFMLDPTNRPVIRVMAPLQNDNNNPYPTVPWLNHFGPDSFFAYAYVFNPANGNSNWAGALINFPGSVNLNERDLNPRLTAAPGSSGIFLNTKILEVVDENENKIKFKTDVPQYPDSIGKEISRSVVDEAARQQGVEFDPAAVSSLSEVVNPEMTGFETGDGYSGIGFDGSFFKPELKTTSAGLTVFRSNVAAASMAQPYASGVIPATSAGSVYNPRQDGDHTFTCDFNLDNADWGGIGLSLSGHDLENDGPIVPEIYLNQGADGYATPKMDVTVVSESVIDGTNKQVSVIFSAPLVQNGSTRVGITLEEVKAAVEINQIKGFNYTNIVYVGFPINSETIGLSPVTKTGSFGIRVGGGLEKVLTYPGEATGPVTDFAGKEIGVGVINTVGGVVTNITQISPDQFYFNYTSKVGKWGGAIMMLGSGLNNDGYITSFYQIPAEGIVLGVEGVNKIRIAVSDSKPARDRNGNVIKVNGKVQYRSKTLEFTVPAGSPFVRITRARLLEAASDFNADQLVALTPLVDENVALAGTSGRVTIHTKGLEFVPTYPGEATGPVTDFAGKGIGVSVINTADGVVADVVQPSPDQFYFDYTSKADKWGGAIMMLGSGLNSDGYITSFYQIPAEGIVLGVEGVNNIRIAVSDSKPARDRNGNVIKINGKVQYRSKTLEFTVPADSPFVRITRARLLEAASDFNADQLVALTTVVDENVALAGTSGRVTIHTKGLEFVPTYPGEAAGPVTDLTGTGVGVDVVNAADGVVTDVVQPSPDQFYFDYTSKADKWGGAIMMLGSGLNSDGYLTSFYKIPNRGLVMKVTGIGKIRVSGSDSEPLRDANGNVIKVNGKVQYHNETLEFTVSDGNPYVWITRERLSAAGLNPNQMVALTVLVDKNVAPVGTSGRVTVDITGLEWVPTYPGETSGPVTDFTGKGIGVDAINTTNGVVANITQLNSNQFYFDYTSKVDKWGGAIMMLGSGLNSEGYVTNFYQIPAEGIVLGVEGVDKIRIAVSDSKPARDADGNVIKVNGKVQYRSKTLEFAVSAASPFVRITRARLLEVAGDFNADQLVALTTVVDEHVALAGTSGRVTIDTKGLEFVPTYPGEATGPVTDLTGKRAPDVLNSSDGVVTNVIQTSSDEFYFDYTSKALSWGGVMITLGSDTNADENLDVFYPLPSDGLVYKVNGIGKIRVSVGDSKVVGVVDGKNQQRTVTLEYTVTPENPYIRVTAARLLAAASDFRVNELSTTTFVIDENVAPAGTSGRVTIGTKGLEWVPPPPSALARGGASQKAVAASAPKVVPATSVSFEDFVYQTSNPDFEIHVKYEGSTKIWTVRNTKANTQAEIARIEGGPEVWDAVGVAGDVTSNGTVIYAIEQYDETTHAVVGYQVYALGSKDNAEFNQQPVLIRDVSLPGLNLSGIQSQNERKTVRIIVTDDNNREWFADVTPAVYENTTVYGIGDKLHVADNASLTDWVYDFDWFTTDVKILPAEESAGVLEKGDMLAVVTGHDANGISGEIFVNLKTRDILNPETFEPLPIKPAQLPEPQLVPTRSELRRVTATEAQKEPKVRTKSGTIAHVLPEMKKAGVAKPAQLTKSISEDQKNEILKWSLTPPVRSELRTRARTIARILPEMKKAGVTDLTKLTKRINVFADGQDLLGFSDDQINEILVFASQNPLNNANGSANPNRFMMIVDHMPENEIPVALKGFDNIKFFEGPVNLAGLDVNKADTGNIHLSIKMNPAANISGKVENNKFRYTKKTAGLLGAACLREQVTDNLREKQDFNNRYGLKKDNGFFTDQALAGIFQEYLNERFVVTSA
ncbi:MAG: hypothetical protein WC331_07015 [Candidatus Omnitrophota bacterium]